MVEYLDQEKDGRYVIQSADYIFTVLISSYASTVERDGMIAAMATFMENIAKNVVHIVKLTLRILLRGTVRPRKRKGTKVSAVVRIRTRFLLLRVRAVL